MLFVTEARDELKNQVNASNETIQMKTPSERRGAISIVGFSRQLENQEVVDTLVRQNNFLKQFSETSNINDHITVYAVKPLRNKPDLFQAFARVSSTIRQGLKTFNDKVLIGILTCKVYDQYHIKRCNNCQLFGHFYKDCPTPNTPVCSKCSLNHKTSECHSPQTKCSNCSKDENIAVLDSCHQADDIKCPSMLKAQEKMKNNYLNSMN